jgi:hypothetical protein
MNVPGESEGSVNGWPASGGRQSPVPVSPERNRRWLWYFTILAVLAAGWIAGLYWASWWQQLKPEQLAQAEALWKARGPRDYDLEYTQKGSTPGHFQVRVRHGQVESVLCNGQPLEKRLYQYHDMNAWFGFIGDFLKRDAEPGSPRTFIKATFDPEDGHLKEFRRRVLGTQEQVEIIVTKLAR